MIKDLQKEIKSLAVHGAFRPLEELAEEVKRSIQQPTYETDQGKFLYECGRAAGQREGIEIFINELNQLAR